MFDLEKLQRGSKLALNQVYGNNAMSRACVFKWRKRSKREGKMTPEVEGMQQFGGTNLSVSQFGGKINKNDFPLRALKLESNWKGNCNCSADKSENF